MSSRQFFFLFLPSFFFLSLIENFFVNLFSYRLFDFYISLFLSMLVFFSPTIYLIISYFLISLIKGLNDSFPYYIWFFIFLLFQLLWFFYRNRFKTEKLFVISIFWGFFILVLFLCKFLYFYNLVAHPNFGLLFRVFFKGFFYFSLSYLLSYLFYFLLKEINEPTE